MMKTIPHREFEKMRNILDKYYNYIKTNTESLIIKFYGLHKV